MRDRRLFKKQKTAYEISACLVGSEMCIRDRTYAESIEANSVHGSDSDENAKIEIDFFFNEDEIVG